MFSKDHIIATCVRIDSPDRESSDVARIQRRVVDEDPSVAKRDCGLLWLFGRLLPAEIIAYMNQRYGIREDEILPVREAAGMPRTPENEGILKVLSDRVPEARQRNGRVQRGWQGSEHQEGEFSPKG